MSRPRRPRPADRSSGRSGQAERPTPALSGPLLAQRCRCSACQRPCLRRATQVPGLQRCSAPAGALRPHLIRIILVQLACASGRVASGRAHARHQQGSACTLSSTAGAPVPALRDTARSWDVPPSQAPPKSAHRRRLHHGPWRSKKKEEQVLGAQGASRSGTARARPAPACPASRWLHCMPVPALGPPGMHQMHPTCPAHRRRHRRHLRRRFGRGGQLRASEDVRVARATGACTPIMPRWGLRQRLPWLPHAHHPHHPCRPCRRRRRLRPSRPGSHPVRRS